MPNTIDPLAADWLGPYYILGLDYAASPTAAEVDAAYGTRMCSIEVDPEDPDHEGHAQLRLVSDARSVLTDKTLRSVFDKCYGRAKHIPDVSLSAAELLEVAADATRKQIEDAYSAKLREWSGYETVAAVVIEMSGKARKLMLDNLKKAQLRDQEMQKQVEAQQRQDAERERVDSIVRCRVR